MSTTTKRAPRATKAAVKVTPWESVVDAAATAYVAAERDDVKRGTACRNIVAALDRGKADGRVMSDVYADLEVGVTAKDGRVKPLNASTARSHAAAWRQVVAHYAGRGAVEVAGAAYLAKVGKVPTATVEAALKATSAGHTAAAMVETLDALKAKARQESKAKAKAKAKAEAKADAEAEAEAVALGDLDGALALIRQIADGAWDADERATLAAAMLTAADDLTAA